MLLKIFHRIEWRLIGLYLLLPLITGQYTSGLKVISKISVQDSISNPPPFTNAIAFDPIDRQIYFGTYQGVVRWDPSTNTGRLIVQTQNTTGIGLDVSNRIAYVCTSWDRNIISFPLNGSSFPSSTRYTAPNDVQKIELCAIDMNRPQPTIFYATLQATVSRIDIVRGSSWNGNTPQSTNNFVKSVATATLITDLYVIWAYPNYQIAQFDRFNPDLPSALIRTVSNGAGTFKCLGTDQTWLFVGSSVGIGFKYRLSDLTLANVLFISGHSLDSVIVDSTNGVIYWGTTSPSGSYIARSNVDTFTLLDVVALTETSLISALVLPNVQDMAVWVYPGTSNDSPEIFNVKLTNCSVHKTCQECTGDPQYCGWCSSTSICTRDPTCSVGLWTNDYASCPVLLSLNPVNGSSDGATILTLTSNVPFPTSNVTCLFSNGRQTVADTSSGTSTLMCPTPVGNATTVSVSVLLVGAPFTSNTKNFSYYDCSSPSCDTCVSTSRSECGWCPSTRKCQSRSNPSCSSIATCPRLTSTSPPSSSTAGGMNVTIFGTNFIQGLNYSVHFGAKNVTAFRLSSTQLTCTAPRMSSKGYVNITVYQDATNLYTPDTIPFLFYNCSENYGCGQCVGPLLPDCSFCFQESSCINQGSTCLASLPSQSSCASIVQISPPSALTSQHVNVTINITGNLPPSSEYKCQFGSGIAAVTSNATWLTASSVSCPVPLLPKGSVAVTLLYKGYSYSSNPVSFLYYDCTGSTCSECMQGFQEGCQWCLADNTCGVNRPCSSGTLPNRQCPSISSIFPSSGSLSGGTTVTIDGSYFMDSEEYQCSFDGMIVSAHLVNSTTLTCTSPSVQHVSNVTLSIMYNNTLYTEDTFSFAYYDCLGLNTCSSCSELSECAWCLSSATCTSSNNCSSIAQACPRMVSITPPYCRGAGQKNIVIQGDNIVQDGAYYCGFGSVSVVATYVNQSQLTCVCPPSTSLGVVPLIITKSSNSYFDNSLNFTYFDCSSNWTDCKTCLSKPVCGWCYASQSCLEEELCNVTNAWLTQSCPSITDIEPAYSSIRGGLPITISGTGFLSGIDLRCKFTQNNITVTTNATYVSPTSVTCQSVNATLFNKTVTSKRQLPKQDLGFNIVYLPMYGPNAMIPQPYVESVDRPFAYVDCTPHHTCQDCNASPNCGWCLSTAKCVTSQECTLGFSNGQCPMLGEITPLVGPISGGTQVKITGSLFPSQGLFLYFNNTQATIQSVTNTTVTAITPKSSGIGDIPVTLYYLGSPFGSGNTLRFSYISLNEGAPIASSQASSTLAIVLATVFGVLLIVVIIVVTFLFLYRRRKGGVIFDDALEMPSFELFAFSEDDTTAYELSKKKITTLESLETFLLQSPDRVEFAHLLTNVAQASESEKVARAFVFLHQHTSFPLQLLKSYIFKEIEEADTDYSSIFRAKSIASKMFKFYSRMIGLPYLWQTLAVHVAEICFKDQNSRGLGITHSITIEIDPSKLEDPADEQVNKLQLLLITQKIFNSILKSASQAPNGLRLVCKYIYEEVKEKFPEMEYKALGSFVFLRFFCPAITAPHAYGLLKNAPGDDAQRKLILVSKILQNLANGILFGKKEEFMKKMNEFVEGNMDKLQVFFEELVDIPSDEQPESVQVPRRVVDNSLAFLYCHIYNKIIKINDHILKSNSIKKSTADELAILMDKIGDPPAMAVKEHSL